MTIQAYSDYESHDSCFTTFILYTLYVYTAYLLLIPTLWRVYLKRSQIMILWSLYA